MTVGEGKFVLYSRIEPPLQAGDYRFTASQNLSTSGHDGDDLPADELPVDELPTYVTVRSPRYALPPDQVLSTYPPAGGEGSYGSRLPQVVIRRRTLPWERLVETGVPASTPWLALVLIAEGEAELKLNQPTAQCVTPGVHLTGKADAELGNYLLIRKSMVDRIFPTRRDVPLLAHAREVDIHDTELMMGDDDGFLAVVIANRLPLPGRDEHGEAVPVKYLACLVNLEGQFTKLLPEAPPPRRFTLSPVAVAATAVSEAAWDHLRMGTTATAAPTGAAAVAETPVFGTEPTLFLGSGTGSAAVAHPSTGPVTATPSAAAAPYSASATWGLASAARAHAEVYAEMAAPFAHTAAEIGVKVPLDPALRFPVLLHWSFTSYGATTFRSLMEGLDSGLLGTVADTPAEPAGRPPLEVVETGHTGLAHRLRRGDEVRSWYRGPLVPHPTADPPGGRLPLAHAADQLRIVVPDGREDISLAAAFEIGRLLALARPSMVAALMRWRQGGYQYHRRSTGWAQLAPFLSSLGVGGAVDARIGAALGRALAGAVAQRPHDFLGDPRPLVDAGRPLVLDAAPHTVLAAGFGLAAGMLGGDPAAVLDRLREHPVLTAGDQAVAATAIRTALADTLALRRDALIADTLSPRVDTHPTEAPR
ncbi:hypothetical protein CS0771_47730 [Catellatospora sp. IY07-71]|uniref:hypothetical protein n=1 Tax=Catellatospora sp. IY07-71 TaxID=2728827 RepID=UPI001BB3C4F6|nr:hypothetical protein [Catellatospora sp. IY07-71]BCJ75229.1 hypothetical protein CS0771_47730 [Catellatospora sp. IY07-71]